jgi:Zn-dependent peptidase ImmA (M78 family)
MENLENEDVVSNVDRMVVELLERAQTEKPPVDAIGIAQRTLGMVVCLDSRQSERGRAQRSAGARQIYLRPEPTEERHQWTVAYEIGRHLKPQLLERLGVEGRGGLSPVSLANLFAYRLLVPTCWFRGDASAADYDLLDLKRRYATASHEVIAWRMLDLGDPCIMTIVDNDVIHRRRSNAVRTRRELSPTEAKCREAVHRTGEPCRLRESAWTVQCWPVHRDGWKREILRSVVDEE